MSRCYQQLTLADRRRLHHLVERKVPINEMARQLGRHRSTIFAEIRRSLLSNDVCCFAQTRLIGLQNIFGVKPLNRPICGDRWSGGWN